MDMNSTGGTVVSVFENEAQAATALDALMGEHFDIQSDASVVVSNGRDEQVIPIWAELPMERGAARGAAIGAVLAALGVAIAGLDFGPFTYEEWGRAYAAFEAAYIGALVGVAMGAIMSFGSGRPRAAFHLARTHDGDVRIGVRATGARGELAERIMAEAGGHPAPVPSRPMPAAA